jgi:hypothetical protein
MVRMAIMIRLEIVCCLLMLLFPRIIYVSWITG